jgi:hypothetical protein
VKKAWLLFLLLALVATPVLAHPPKDITATYDPATQVLTVIVLHGTMNGAMHHIKQVTLSSTDGTPFLTQTFSDQYDNGRQVAMAVIPKLKGTLSFQAKADCSLWGSLTKTLTVNIPAGK